MNLIDGNLQVEFEHIGEGMSGDYVEEDPNDVPLLRFTVCELRTDDEGDTQWEQIDDASYCTLVPEDTPEDIQERMLRHIMDEVKGAINSGESIKKVCEGLSWIRPEDFAGDPTPDGRRPMA